VKEKTQSEIKHAMEKEIESKFKDDPIDKSIALRKKEPGETVLNVVRGLKLAEDKPFKLSIKGGQPKINVTVKTDPSLGQQVGGKKEPTTPTQ